MIPLFESYCLGMLAGLASSLKDKRYWAFAFFYSVMIVSAHFYLLPPSGPEFYFGAGGAQLLILVATLMLYTKASWPVGFLAYCAVIINVLTFHNYPSHEGIWLYYYSLINSIQTLQITSLIIFSPASVFLYRVITGRVSVRKESSWLSRSQI